ncbi:MAG: hypothetical protein HYV63_30070 [Candidatus Schekmanbacteria bacterium]|nr:hypothetical protein [Candidatus Schekmanbacteria bacterium]
MYRRATDDKEVYSQSRVTLRVHPPVAAPDQNDQSLYTMLRGALRATDMVHLAASPDGHVCTVDLADTELPGAGMVEQRLADLLSKRAWVVAGRRSARTGIRLH